MNHGHACFWRYLTKVLSSPRGDQYQADTMREMSRFSWTPSIDPIMLATMTTTADTVILEAQIYKGRLPTKMD